jgi:hypothetical protein
MPVMLLAGGIRRKSRGQQEYNRQYRELLHLKPALKGMRRQLGPLAAEST